MSEMLLSYVLKVLVNWHDTTPRGRITGRFSSDMTHLDSTLASDLANVCSFGLSLIGVVVAAQNGKDRRGIRLS